MHDHPESGRFDVGRTPLLKAAGRTLERLETFYAARLEHPDAPEHIGPSDEHGPAYIAVTDRDMLPLLAGLDLEPWEHHACERAVVLSALDALQLDMTSRGHDGSIQLSLSGVLRTVQPHAASIYLHGFLIGEAHGEHRGREAVLDQLEALKAEADDDPQRLGRAVAMLLTGSRGPREGDA